MANTSYVDQTEHRTPDHGPGRLFRSRRERIVAAMVFGVLTAIALGGRPLVQLLFG